MLHRANLQLGDVVAPAVIQLLVQDGGEVVPDPGALGDALEVLEDDFLGVKKVGGDG